MHKLYSYICDELKDLEKKADSSGLSVQELQYGDTLAHFGKNLEKMMDGDGEHSGGMYPDGRGSYRYDDGFPRARSRRDRYQMDGYSRMER